MFLVSAEKVLFFGWTPEHHHPHHYVLNLNGKIETACRLFKATTGAQEHERLQEQNQIIKSISSSDT